MPYKLSDLYPLVIKKFESFVPLNDGWDEITKLNKIIEYLNSVGQLSQNVANNWNKVMQWVTTDGLTETVQLKIDDMVAKGTFDSLLKGMFNDIDADVQQFKTDVNTQLAEKAYKTRDWVIPKVVGDIQTALNSGSSVYIPKGVTFTTLSTLVFKFDGQQIDGEGTLIANTSLDAPVISGTNLKRLRVKNVSIQASGTVNSIGVKFDGCYRSFAEYSAISNYGDSGVSITNSTWVTARKNEFTNAASNPSFNAPTSKDVNIYGTNKACNVEKNICKSNGGYGIHIRTFNDNENNDNHIIKENEIDGYNSYGIMVYRNAQTAPSIPLQSVANIIIEKNTVKNISGSRPSDMSQPTVLIFGCGIYLQGAEFVHIENNTVDTVCTSNNSELLTPAGIGLTNLGNAKVLNNTIKNSSKYGLYVSDPNNYGDANGKVIFEGNEIINCTKSGVKILNKNNVQVINNPMNSVEFGVIVTVNSGTQKNLIVSKNNISNCSQTGISIASTNDVLTEGNLIDTATTHGISFSSVNGATVKSNRVKNATSRGYYFDSVCSGLNIFEGNTATSCGVGGYINAPVKLNDNIMESNTTNWQGTNAPFGTLTDNATPDVKYRKVVAIAPTSATTITNFTNGELNQQLTIQATNGNATIQNNANILLSGGTNFTMASNAVLQLLKTAGVWVEVGRKS